MAETTIEDLRRHQATNPPFATTLPETIGLTITETLKQRLEQKRLEEAASPEMPDRSATQAVVLEARRVFDARAKIARILGQRYSPERASLATFEATDAAQKAVVSRLKALVTNLPELISKGRGLVFYGSVGTGKDHLLAAMLYAACEVPVSCHWVNGQEVYGRFRDAMDTNQREAEILAELVKPNVLAISDPIPPVAAPTPYNLQQLYRLLDLRYRELKSTWVSLNALSPEDADAKLSAPVFDRLREGAEMFRCFWPSFRERKRVRPYS